MRILTITIGIAVGSLLTLGVQEILHRSKPSYVIAKSQRVDKGWISVNDHSTENFLILEGYQRPQPADDKITLFGNASRKTEYILRVEPETRNGISVELGMTDKKIHSISLKDKSETFLWIIDDNLDGLYDDALFETDGLYCDYARSSIFPMMYWTPTGKVVRIDGEYHELDSIGHSPWVKIDEMWHWLERKSGQGYTVEE